MSKAEDLIQPRNRHILRFSSFAGNPLYKISGLSKYFHLLDLYFSIEKKEK